MTERHEKRCDFHHRLSITYHQKIALESENQFGRGAVLDWSAHGLKISSSIPFQEETPYHVRFHVEKNNGLTSMKKYISREGQVRWVREKENQWYVGILLNQELVKLDEYILEEDSCYVFFMPKESTSEKV
ncbi:MAG: PilZ domain-containing protein [SAR324 cluster bacterium]|nr:PilZ domain-containing protein [SAR324 cluster bacterium]